MKKSGPLFITNDVPNEFGDSGPLSFCVGQLVKPVDLGLGRLTIIGSSNITAPEEATPALAKRIVGEALTAFD